MSDGATEVTMPQMGADMEEGTLLRWLKQPGDHIARGEPIAEIETDKANIEIEAFEEGVLQQTLAEEGQVVPVGGVIALIAPVNGAAPSPRASPEPQSRAPAAAQVEGAAVQPLEEESRAVGPAKEERAPAAVQPQPSTSAALRLSEPPQTATGQRLRVSPVARGIAEELGLDLGHVQGSGPDGRIMRKDVERAAAEQGRATHVAAGADTQPKRWVDEARAQVPQTEVSPQPAPPARLTAVSETLAPQAATQQTAPQPAQPRTDAREQPRPEQPRAEPPDREPAQPEQPRPAQPQPSTLATGEVTPFSRMRQAIARRMAQSKRESPHYYVTAEIDMTEAMAFRTSLNQAGGEDAHVSVNDLIVKACAEVLRRYPHFNAAFAESGLRLNERINICIGVALPDGLIAPALIDVGSKSLGAIARQAKDLADRARNGGLKGPELNDGTFTISNLGMYGIETLIPIIQPPQSAILGVGAVQEKPAVRDGQIVARKLLLVALAADHRVTDGAEGAEFLRELKRLLEQPLSLAL